MNTQRIAGIMALSGLSATAAYAMGPFSLADDQSWHFFNTPTAPGELGIGALANPTLPTQPCWPYSLSARTKGTYYMSGCANTATGFLALANNTTGYQNTADGAGALYK